jgi:hypothetical protein
MPPLVVVVRRSDFVGMAARPLKLGGRAPGAQPALDILLLVFLIYAEPEDGAEPQDAARR